MDTTNLDGEGFERLLVVGKDRRWYERLKSKKDSNWDSVVLGYRTERGSYRARSKEGPAC